VTRFSILLASAPLMLLLGSNAPPAGPVPVAAAAVAASEQVAPVEAMPVWEAAAPLPVVEPLPEPPPPPPPPPFTPKEAMADGVLIVVSIASQKAYVFRHGELWDSSKVSTGRRGHETPVGEFSILQKKAEHRSNLYDDAPMPYMQRLTWDGVALHAGSVPGYPASHGCIRLPKAFAKKLYGITGFRSTAVVVTEERVGSADAALDVV
jgi:lipoprotein-anchoring transpeptidase ErfK/SrfK